MTNSMQHIKQLLLLFIFLLGLSVNLYAQSGKIKGTILDAETSDPLIGATINIKGTLKGQAADLDGNYLLLNVAPGTYILEVRYIGYVTQFVENVLVRTDLTTSQDFKLTPESFTGEEIVITATQPMIIKDLTSSEARVSSEEIEKLPVQELGDVIQLQAGVNVGDDGQIRIRGGRASEVSYVVDGIRVTDDYNRGQGLRIENQAVEELQVISGTFNAEHGQAMSGIINVVTKSGSNEFRANFNGWSGDYVTGNNAFSGVSSNLGDVGFAPQYNLMGSIEGPIIKDRVTFFASARRFENEGWLKGYNAFSPTGPYQETLPLGTDLSTYRTAYGQTPDLSQPWNSVTPTTIEGQDVLLFRDTGVRDSSLVNMNTYESTNFQGNIQFNISKMLKFNLIGSYGTEEGKGYNHNRKLAPGGIGTSFRSNSLINLKTTLTPSNKTFLTFNLAWRNNSEDNYLYENAWDPRYYNYENIAIFGAQQPGLQFQFDQLGTDNGFNFRNIDTYVAKVEVSTQFSDRHFIKAGINVQYDVLNNQGYSLQPLDPDNGIFLPDGTPEDLIPFVELGIPAVNTPGHQKYRRDPINFSAYIQDKVEYEKLIINFGIRFDYFDANTFVAADPRDPDITNPTSTTNRGLTLEQREEFWWRDVEAKTQFSPRLGIAYPITDTGVLHFSYGYFFQMPTYNFLYDGSQILLPQSAGVFGPYGNPDLDPERSIQYELGYKSEIFPGTAIEITGFYKDSRDYVSSGQVQSTYNPTVRYGTWINRDYANSRGATFVLNQNIGKRLNFSIDYTYTRVEGSNSDPAAEFSAVVASGTDNAENLTKLIQLLDWDRSQVLNGLLFYQGKSWSANVVGRYLTGEPYTPSTPFLIRSGLAASQRNLVNTARLPGRFTINLNLNKTFKIGDYELRSFLQIFNLLDDRQVVGLYPDSGEPDRPIIVPVSAERSFLNIPGNYAEPRRIQLGFNISL